MIGVPSPDWASDPTCNQRSPSDHPPAVTMTFYRETLRNAGSVQGPICPHLSTQCHCSEDAHDPAPSRQAGAHTRKRGSSPRRHLSRNAQQLLPSWGSSFFITQVAVSKFSPQVLSFGGNPARDAQEAQEAQEAQRPARSGPESEHTAQAEGPPQKVSRLFGSPVSVSPFL